MANPIPRSMTVLRSQRVSPSMHQITLGGGGLRGFPSGQAGGYIKLLIPSGKLIGKPIMRTYTIRAQRSDEIDVQFALHGDNAAGPATSWALNTQIGDTIRVGGPGPKKPLPEDRDFYLVAGDMSALPAIAANLEGLPETARGVAVIEVQNEADAIPLSVPIGIELRWLINETPGSKPNLLANALRQIELPDGSLYGWAACEFGGMRACRAYLREELGLGARDLYISSYWKHGLNENQHKDAKRKDAALAAA